MTDDPKKNQFELYKIIRSEIQHEYSLISTRLGWLLASQVFLLSTLVIGGKFRFLPPNNNINFFEMYKYILPVANKSYSEYDIILCSFTMWVGFMISILILLSTWAAILRVSIWESSHDEIYTSLLNTDYSFGVRRGSELIHLLGISSAIYLPAVFVVVWTYILFQVDFVDIAFKLTNYLSISNSIVLFLSFSCHMIAVCIISSMVSIRLHKSTYRKSEVTFRILLGIFVNIIIPIILLILLDFSNLFIFNYILLVLVSSVSGLVIGLLGCHDKSVISCWYCYCKYAVNKIKNYNISS